MRELKFRAWDGRNNEWLYDFNKFGGFHLFGEIMVLGGWLNGISLKDWDKIIVQQYTGLKDSKGKEIYEGDLVRFLKSDPTIISEIIYSPKSYGLCLVSLIENNITEKTERVECDLMRIRAAWGPQDFELEVVGNIFENPELL